MEASQNPQNEELQARQMLEALTGQQHEEHAAPPAQEQPRDEPHVPKYRFDEMVERARRSEQQNERLIRELLSGQHQQAANQQQDPGYDPDVYEQVAPILQRELEKEREAILGPLRPVIEHVNQQMGMDQLRESLSGFDELKEEVKKRYDALPEEEKQLYNNRIGAEALYGQVLSERFASERQRRSSGNMAARAHTASGTSSAQSTDLDPFGLSAGAFEKLLEGIRRQT